MNTKFYSSRFRDIKKSIKKLIIFEIIIMLLFSVLCYYADNDYIKGISLFYTLVSLFKIFFLHDLKRYAYYYEYDLETGKDLYQE